jgi:hypothetical protein
MFRHTSTDGKVSSKSVDISHENLLREAKKQENCRPHHFVTEGVYRNTNGKVIHVHAVKAHGGSRGVAPPILTSITYVHKR